MRLIRNRAAQLGEKPRLPEPCFADEEDDETASARRPREALAELRELALASDEAAVPRDLGSGRAWTPSRDGIGDEPTRVADAEIPHVKLAGALDPPRDLRRDEDLVRARVAEQALRHHDGVADREHARDRVRTGGRGVDAQAAQVDGHAELGLGTSLAEQPMDRERRLHGALRKLLERARDAERRAPARRRAREEDAAEAGDALLDLLRPAPREGPRLEGVVREHEVDRQHSDRLHLPARRRVPLRRGGRFTDRRALGRYCRRRGEIVEARPLDTVTPHAMAKRVPPETEETRGADDVAAGAGEGVVDACGLVVVVRCRARRSRRGHRRCRRGRRRGQRHAQPFEDRVIDGLREREQRHALHQMRELADVARPRMRREPAPPAPVERFHGEAMRGGVRGEEVLGEDDHVLRPLSQRRQVEHDDGEAMVEIDAKAPGRDHRQEIALRCRDQLHVDPVRSDRAEAAHALLLDRLQELPLQRERQRVDLVEKEAAAAGGLEEARLRALGVGERAGLEAEELGLEHRLRDRRAVDVDERRARAPAAGVDRAGDEPLTGARFPLQEYRWNIWIPRRVEGGEVQDLRPQRVDSRGASNDGLDGVVRHWPRPPLARAARGGRAQALPSPEIGAFSRSHKHTAPASSLRTTPPITLTEGGSIDGSQRGRGPRVRPEGIR